MSNQNALVLLVAWGARSPAMLTSKARRIADAFERLAAIAERGRQ